VRAFEGGLITSPLSSNPVTIDGKWTTPDEWSDAVVVKMYFGITSTTQGNGTAYLYAKHDASNFYFLIDFISATTLSPAQDGGAVQIDSKHDGGNTAGPDDVRFEAMWAGGSMAIGTGGSDLSWDHPLPSGVHVAFSMSSSPNSATPHEVSEFEIPFSTFPQLQNTIGFAAAAHTPYQLAIWPHVYYVSIPSTWGELTISSTPVPEFGNIWLVVAASLATLGLIVRSKRSKRV
jgi:hypothetical protein